jgi:hypothetical protein
MARSAGVSIENNFSRGLITEVTGVNSPENSVTETKNMIYDRRGRAFPRPAFGYEENHTLPGVDALTRTGVRNEYLWETFSTGGSKSFVVVQFGSIIRFFETGESNSLSSGFKSFYVYLPSYSTGFSESTISASPASFTSGRSYLFIAHPNCRTLYVKYNESSDTITVNTINIQIRDFEGLDDGLAVDAHPGQLSLHEYNLYNQGWNSTAQRYGSEYISSVNVLSAYVSRYGYWPSNADVWWYYLAANPQQGTKPDEATGLEAFDPRLASTQLDLYGSTRPAPKGHHIINALSTNRTAVSGISVPEESSGGYQPSVVAFYMGRAFYGGVQSQKYASTIYFSQIIQSDSDLGKCYQSNDPTSREAFDLLSSDGGVIKIQDIANIIDMRVIGDALYVFASNGLWAVTGSDNGPFKATDYVVRKISSFPAIARQSIVDVGGVPVWWNYEGIFTLQKDAVGLSSEVTSLTLPTIQTFYDDIPASAKLSAKGAFNDQESLVYWLYQDQDDQTYVYDKILVLDVGSGSFYHLDLPTTGPLVCGLIPLRTVRYVYDDEPVTASGGNVTNNANDPVTVEVFEGLRPTEKVFKFLVTSGNSASFAEMYREDYLDWGTTSYEYYFITGHRIRGDILKNFQTNYLTVITEEISGASCYVQGVWDYTNSSISGRYTNPQQVCRTRQYRNHQMARLVMRGNGRSLQFRFFGEAGKPFIIVGWSGFETTNDLP